MSLIRLFTYLLTRYPSIRSRIRNDETEEIYDSYFIRLLYEDEKGARGIEQGLLMGPLLVQVCS